MNAFDMLFKLQELQLTREMIKSAVPKQLDPESKMTICESIADKHPDWSDDRITKFAKLCFE